MSKIGADNMKSSTGEVKIHNILTDYQVPFSEEQEFDGLVTNSGRHLRFDFCVFRNDGSIDFLIEFQGRQHYKPVSKFGGAAGLRKQKYNDARKRKFCVSHGLKLIAIPYWDEPKLSYEYIMHAAGYY